MSEEQRRRLERFPVSATVTLRVETPDREPAAIDLSGHVSDLSERGAMVEVALEPDSHRRLTDRKSACRMSFDKVPDLPTLTGRPIWFKSAMAGGIKALQVGLYFDPPPEAAAGVLRDWLASNGGTIRGRGV